MTVRKSYSKDFKFKVVIELLKNDRTVAQICEQYSVPKSVCLKWKAQFLKEGSGVFANNDKKSSAEQHDKEINKLHSVIGRLKVENDFLQEVSAKLKL